MNWFKKQTTNTYTANLERALSRGDIDECTLLLKAAFNEYANEPKLLIELLSRVADSYEYELFPFIHYFCEKYPEELNATQIDLAFYYTCIGYEGAATELARDFLSVCAKNRVFDTLQKDRILSIVVGRAFLVFISGYAKAGARSYSMRLLQQGLALRHIDIEARRVLESEVKRLDEELKLEENRKLDEKWEAFFMNSENLDELSNLCKELNLPELAQRMEVLATQMRYGSDVPFNAEFLKQVASRNLVDVSEQRRFA